MPLTAARKPGPVGPDCIGGVMEHLPALTAIGCSTVNSYRRLWDTGFWAPVYADWGYQNRTCGLRVSAPGPVRVPGRRRDGEPVPDGGRPAEGLRRRHRRKLDPGEPEQRNIYEAMKEGKAGKKLPMSLGEALERWRRTRSSSGACRTRCTGSSRTTSATSGSGSWPPSPSGTSSTYPGLPAADCAMEGRSEMCGIAGMIHREADAAATSAAR